MFVPRSLPLVLQPPQSLFGMRGVGVSEAEVKAVGWQKTLRASYADKRDC
jgi:hypothetical protein